MGFPTLRSTVIPWDGMSMNHHLAVDHIDRNRATTRHPQANLGPEYFDQAMSYGFYRVAFRKEIYWTLDGLQAKLDS
jgi:hypothetical protein